MDSEIYQVEFSIKNFYILIINVLINKMKFLNKDNVDFF